MLKRVVIMMKIRTKLRCFSKSVEYDVKARTCLLFTEAGFS